MLESLDKICCIQYNQATFSIIPGAPVVCCRVGGAHVSFIDLRLYQACG